MTSEQPLGRLSLSHSNRIPAMDRRRWLLGASLSFIVACSRPYRIGDFVLVEWGEEKLLYPAYVVAKKSNTRFRVHFDGYPARFDEDVTLDRISGFVTGSPVKPPPPEHVRLLLPATEKDQEKAPLGGYRVGDRIRVRFRGSIYRATVLEVVGPEKLKVHYEGHESAWDEVIETSRVLSTP